MVNNAIAAADLLARKGIDISVIRLLKLNPLPMEALEAVLSGITRVLIVEEASAGIHEALAWQLRDYQIACIDLGSEYVTHGSVAELYRKYGMDAESIASRVQEEWKVEN